MKFTAKKMVTITMIPMNVTCSHFFISLLYHCREEKKYEVPCIHILRVKLLAMSGQNRDDIYSGLTVDIILKKDQGSGKLTRGQVQDILTSSSFHGRGIKVRLASGEIGRVAHIIE